MSELVDIYMAARFGKEAVNTPKTPTKPAGPMFSSEQLTASPQLKKLRDAIERSLKTERGLRGEAGEAARHAQTLATTPQGGLSKVIDAIRAAAPGAAPSPAVGAGPHAAAVGGGAALGGLLQRMLRSPTRIAQELGTAGRADVFGTPSLSKAVAGLPERFSMRRLPFVGGTSGSAFSTALGKLRAGGGGILRRLLRGRGGAVAGALLGTAVPAYLNLRRTKRLRSIGGPGGVKALGAAKTRLQKAEMIRRWRSAQLTGLEQLGGTGTPPEVPYEPFLQHAPRVDVRGSMTPVTP